MKNISNKKLARLIGKHNLKGKTFVGLDPEGRPKFLTESQRRRHLEVIGLSGSGKTSRVILPMIFQDICEEKCVISIDGKGDKKFAEAVYASLLIKEDFKAESPISAVNSRFFYLNPAIPDVSNAYNPVHTHSKTDLSLLSERVFRAFQITHEHWGPVGLDMLRFLIRALYGTGKQFALSDIYSCLKVPEARAFVFKESKDVSAVQELKLHFESTQKGREDAFAQFKVKLSELNIPILNNYNPDIIPEELVDQPAVICVSLPDSYKTLSYGIGNMFMEDMKVAVGKRFLASGDNHLPCAIYTDEIQSCLCPKVMLSALTQFRGANCQLTFAHPSQHDLRLYDPGVANAVWANSQMKIILPTNDGEMSEKLSDIVGTEKSIIKTSRTTQGPLFTTKPTYEASTREADIYEHHPNIFKKMRSLGQGVLLSPKMEDEKHSLFKRMMPLLKGNTPTKKDSLTELAWTLTPVNFAPLPLEIASPLPKPSSKKSSRLEGLNLYERFMTNAVIKA